MTGKQALTPDQMARASAALDVWFTNPGGDEYRAPGVTWDSEQLERMHAALEAPTVDAALEAFDVVPGTWLSTPEQDKQNRAIMIALREAHGDGGTSMARVRDVARGLRYDPDARTYIVSDESGSYVISTPYSDIALHWWRLHHPEAGGPDFESAVVRHHGSCAGCPGCAALRLADRARRGL